MEAQHVLFTGMIIIYEMVVAAKLSSVYSVNEFNSLLYSGPPLGMQINSGCIVEGGLQ